jgi:cysteinylglycine-S-conjugate dipeptidase
VPDSLLDELNAWLRIPSVSSGDGDPLDLERAARWVCDRIEESGGTASVVPTAGNPLAVGELRSFRDDAPTVLIYGHYDVQGSGPLDQWDSDAFEPEVRDGRLYGRGTADDKAGIMAHIAALRAFGEDLPVGVVLFIEGEEEFGSESLEDLLREHRDELASDVIVIADSGNWDVGQPALTTGLRGIVNGFFEVRVLEQAVHSGMFGGAVPDALITLSRLISTLHDDAGDVAVEGLVTTASAPLDYPQDRFREEAGMLDGVEFIGTGRLVERLWTRPAISILGIDAPPTEGAPNALIPVAKAKFSVRIAPGDSAQRVYDTMTAHLERHVPWGAKVEVTLEQLGEPCVIDATGPVFDAARQAFTEAWDGVAPVDMGVGGSIPFIATFQELFPKAAILVTGVEDPSTKAHGPNESLHLGEFERVCIAEALLLAKVASTA